MKREEKRAENARFVFSLSLTLVTPASPTATTRAPTNTLTRAQARALPHGTARIVQAKVRERKKDQARMAPTPWRAAVASSALASWRSYEKVLARRPVLTQTVTSAVLW